MARKRWRDLDPRVQQAIVAGAALDAGLKIAALIDLAKQPRESVRGSKVVWGFALAAVNSGGLLPIVYLLRGRRLPG